MSLSDEEIVSLLDGYERETKAIIKESLRLSWYMRGGVSYDDIMAMGQVEVAKIGEILKENMELSKKIGRPIF